MNDAHERTHDEGRADEIARAIREWRADRTPATHDKLETLLRDRMDGDAPLERLIEAMEPGPDDEAEGGALREIERERKDALRFLAETRPLATFTPPEYPTATERAWLLYDWLPRGRVTLFTGPGGKGKSRLALQLASAMAAGERCWLGTQKDAPFIRGGSASVVFATYEDEPEEAWRRLEAIQTVMGPRPPNGRFTLVDLAGEPPLWGPPSASTHPNAPPELTGKGRQVRGECEKQEARLLIIDPLAAAFAANENDRTVVRSFIGSWDKWGRENDCAVLVIAHPPKEKPGERRIYSGSTDWLGGPRSLLVLDSQTEKATATEPAKSAPFMRVAKVNYGSEGAVIWLTEEKPPKGPPVFCESPTPDYSEHGNSGGKKTDDYSRHA